MRGSSSGMAAGNTSAYIIFQSSVSVLSIYPGHFLSFSVHSDIDIWKNIFWKLENHHLGCVWWVLIFGTAMHFQTPHHVSDLLPFLDYHLWRQLIFLCPSLVILIWIRVNWLLISPLIGTCFLYNESILWYWYFREMQIPYSAWNWNDNWLFLLESINYNACKRLVFHFQSSLHSSLGDPL